MKRRNQLVPCAPPKEPRPGAGTLAAATTAPGNRNPDNMTQPANNADNAPDDSSMTNALPSAAMTARFLVLCDAYGSQQLAIHIVAAGRTSGVAGLPATNDWPQWNASEMRSAVEHLEHKRGMR